MKPVVLVADYDFYPSGAIECLSIRFDVLPSSARSAVELRRELSATNAFAYFCGLGIYLGEESLSEAIELRLIVSPATGTNHFDSKFLLAQNIEILKLGDFKDQIQNIFATAELAWGLAIACARRLDLATESVKVGNFDRTPFLGRELSGKTLGVVGFGRLGQQVAKYGSAFGMNVVVFETDKTKHATISPFRKIDSLALLMSISDVISVHIPLTDKNEKCINAEMISKIKPGAIFINTSRGELVDEFALASSLRSGQLFGVGVDVLRNESSGWFSASNSPLVSAMNDGLNVIVTPHIGGWSHDAVAITRSIMVDEFLKRCENLL